MLKIHSQSHKTHSAVLLNRNAFGMQFVTTISSGRYRLMCVSVYLHFIAITLVSFIIVIIIKIT